MSDLEFFDLLLRLDCRLAALEIALADRFHDQNEEQREAFHEEVTRIFQRCYEIRLKQAEKIEPLTVKQMRALVQKPKNEED
jgi:hypothetical protein